MSTRLFTFLAWLLWALMTAAVGVGVALVIAIHKLTADTIALGLAFNAFPLVGAIIISRRSQNVIGWICLGIGLGTATTFFSATYMNYGLTRFRHLPPGFAVVDWMGNWVWPLNMGLGFLLLLLFPTGRLLSRRWRWVAWSGEVIIAVNVVSSAFMPGAFSGESTINPFGIETLGGALHTTNDFTSTLFIPLAFLSVISAIVRFWRSRGPDREQMKWFAYGAALLVLCIVLNLLFLPENNNLGFAAGYAMLPSGIGIAILRYRLYDIDVIIRRTLIYGVLTSVLAALYFGLVFGAQFIVRALTGQTGQQPIFIVAVTLLVAALFSPLRRGIQALIDRRFYRRKYDAARTLDAFGATLRTELDLPQLSDHLLAVVQQTMQPAHVALVLLAPQPSGTPSAHEVEREPHTASDPAVSRLTQRITQAHSHMAAPGGHA